MEIKLGIERYSLCITCHERTVEESSLDTVFKLNCDRCYWKRLEEAMLIWSCNTKETLDSCEFCSESFALQQRLIPHQCMRNINVYHCPYCGLQLESIAANRRHIEMVHKKKIKKTNAKKVILKVKVDQDFKVPINCDELIVCEICNKIFKKHRYLKIHYKLHNNIKPLECTVCNKMFNFPSQLKDHLLTHSCDRPYKCEVCNGTFRRSRDLTYHSQIHKDGFKPFQCDFCTKTFNWPQDLRVHIRSHTGDKPFECKVCKKKFISTTHLKTHFRVHTGDQPYQCKYCNKKYKQSSTLTKHLKQRHGDCLQL